MVLCGPSVKYNQNPEIEDRKSKAISIAQQLMYNAVKKKHNKPATNIRHRVDRETPLAIYIALKVYGATEHSRESLNRLHKLGICVSYDRVSKDMANSVSKCLRQKVNPVVQL